MILTAILASVIPILLYLFFIWRLDRNEPEPIRFVALHFLYGATGAIILGLLGSIAITTVAEYFFSDWFNGIYETIFIAPIVEELAKSLLLFRTVRNENIDNLTDGLVYGGAIGLGFGMTENYFYYMAYGTSIEQLLPLIFLRTFFSVTMHMVSTATIGAFMARAKFSDKRKFNLFTATGFSIAVIIHFSWNLFAKYDLTLVFGMITILFFVIVFIFTFRHSLNSENKIIREKLKDEIPEELLEIISTKKKFNNSWFIPEDRKHFIKTATKLAFRKHEVEISETIDELYIKEISDLTKEVKTMIMLYEEYKTTTN